jgi:hypothetical protein
MKEVRFVAEVVYRHLREHPEDAGVIGGELAYVRMLGQTWRIVAWHEPGDEGWPSAYRGLTLRPEGRVPWVPSGR